MSCNIVINQQSSLSASDRSTLEAKVKDIRRVKQSKKSYEMRSRYADNQDNQDVQMTLKDFIDYFQQGLNDPASMLMTIEKNNAYYERRTQS